MFYIDLESKNIVYADASDPERSGYPHFASEKALLAIADTEGWSKEQVTAIWNTFAGVPPFQQLKRQMMFKNRPYGISAIWKAVQRLKTGEDTTPQPKPASVSKPPKRAKDVAKKPRTPEAATAGNGTSDTLAKVVTLISRPNGASIDELMTKMEWTATHTARGRISILKSKGYAIESFRHETRGRVYRIA